MAITNRRQLLTGAAAYAAGAAIVAGGAALASEAKGATISPSLAALIAAANAAQRASELHDRTVLRTARRQAQSLIDAIPHVSANIDDCTYWTTANPGSVRMARRLVDDHPNRGDLESRPLRDFVAASHRRDRQVTRINKATGLSAACERSDKLGYELAEALDAVALHPIGTVTDLRTKLAFMSKHSMGDGRNWLDEINADVLRIAAAGEAQA